MPASGVHHICGLLILYDNVRRGARCRLRRMMGASLRRCWHCLCLLCAPALWAALVLCVCVCFTIRTLLGPAKPHGRPPRTAFSTFSDKRGALAATHFPHNIHVGNANQHRWLSACPAAMGFSAPLPGTICLSPFAVPPHTAPSPPPLPSCTRSSPSRLARRLAIFPHTPLKMMKPKLPNLAHTV